MRILYLICGIITLLIGVGYLVEKDLGNANISLIATLSIFNAYQIEKVKKDV